MVWEIVFMLVILKIPVVYLGCVVWWAIRAEPEPLEGAALPARIEPREPWSAWRRRRSRPRRGGPHGSRTRAPARAARMRT